MTPAEAAAHAATHRLAEALIDAPDGETELSLLVYAIRIVEISSAIRHVLTHRSKGWAR